MLRGFDKQHEMLHQGAQCTNPPFYTRVEAKQDIELHITLEPFRTQTRQVEATVVTTKLCRQQLSERNSAVAEIRV